jgi:competence protein ComEA
MKKLLIFLLSFLLAAAVSAAVNLNTASREQLQTLKGIGPSKAQAIIDYREQHGPFRSVDELVKVRGIGEKTLRRLEKSLTVVGPTVIDPDESAPRRRRAPRSLPSE